jgi:hypothetical protein
MTLRISLILAASIIALQGLALFALGQPPICACGYVKVWESVVLSTGNSQHLADWYTFSHIIHGIIFFFALRWLFPRLPWGAWLALAVGIEAAWEVSENTPMVIEHYRQQALAVGYSGDSIINSVSDTLAMVLGFFAARRFPWWAVVGAALALEAFTLFMIRDSLALNVLGFVAPDLLASWQVQ